MKSTVKILMSFVFASVLILYSCGSDDDSGGPAPSASDISVTINENPTSGNAIGTITTNLIGTLSFSISSQSVPNALTVNVTTGEVTVSDGLAFDFESNPTITAAVSVTNSTETATGNVTVTLNDIDDILSFLTTSQAAYNAAGAGEWVVITEVEYNALATSLNHISKIATDDADYDLGPTSTTGAFTVLNDNGFVLPSGSYVIAVKFNMFVASSTPNIKIKQSSTSGTSGYADLGDPINAGALGNNYLVLRNSDLPTTATGFLAIFDDSGFIGYRSIAGNLLQFETGDANNLPDSQNDGTVYYQGLSSTQKQWD